MKYSYLVSVVAFFATSANAHDVPSLTPENYDAMTEGKTIFVKFFAPWCGHCKKMAPDWAKLSEEWAGHEIGLVAEVDCTAEGKPLCEAEGVRGFPTLKWGDPSGLEDYTGGRSYDDLSSFAKENLKPVCSPQNIDLCDDKKKKAIEGYLKLSVEEIEKRIQKEEEKLNDAEEEFKKEVEKLQQAYQKLSDNKDKKIAAVKESGLGLLKAVKGYKATASAKNDEL